MSLSQIYFALAFCLCLSSYVTLRLYVHRTKRLPLPPSPAVSRSVATREGRPCQTYALWAKVLGPLISFRVPGQLIIVINTADIALELLSKRRNFACRPRWPMAELMGRQHNVGLQYYGEQLRQGRRILRESLGAHQVAQSCGGLLEDTSYKLMQMFLRSPDTFFVDVERTVEETIYRFTYGSVPRTRDLDLARTVMRQTGEALIPGKWLVNAYPILAYIPAWVPGANFKRWANQARERYIDMIRTPLEEVKTELKQALPNPCFIRRALEASSGAGLDDAEKVIMGAAGSLFSAGTETLSAVILSFILIIMRHPEIQDRAFEEVTALTAHRRLPGVRDRDACPYIDCIIQEVHRFNPAIPLMTRSNMEEDEYMGYSIPKKTWILANIWAMLHDETVYSNPGDFNPDRFKPTEGRTIPPDPRTMVYGFSRRQCPGIHLANDFLFLVISRLLALFKIFPEERGGHSLPAELKFSTGFVAIPEPFGCNFRPREHTLELIDTVIAPIANSNCE